MGNVKMKDVITEDGKTIMCPYCKGIRVMPQKTTIYSSTGRITVCDESEQKTKFAMIQKNYNANVVIQDTNTSTNKTKSENAISICFYCESCDHYSEMYISRYVDLTLHRGWAKTQIGWTQSLHINKEDYTK